MTQSSCSRHNVLRRHRERGFSMIELVVVVAIAVVVAAFAVPRIQAMLRASRLAGDTQNLREEIGLAKMRAAANFTQVRIHVNLANGTYQLEQCRQNLPAAPISPNCTGLGYSWLNAAGQPVEGPYALSQGVTLGFGGIGVAPPNTQPGISQAPACRDNANGFIANSACITFNSRGLSIDGTLASALTPNGAVYISNGQQVAAVTVTATGLIQAWRAQVNDTSWSRL